MENSGKKKFEHPLNGKGCGEFTWCLHCERVNRTEKWVRNGWDCPEEGCDGSILDAHSWGADDWPKDVNPAYPEIPIEGVRYPLHGR